MKVRNCFFTRLTTADKAHWWITHRTRARASELPRGLGRVRKFTPQKEGSTTQIYVGTILGWAMLTTIT
jgi:hypothetical protein